MTQFRTLHQDEADLPDPVHGFEHVGDAVSNNTTNLDWFGADFDSKNWSLPCAAATFVSKMNDICATADSGGARIEMSANALDLVAVRIPRDPELDNKNLSQMVHTASIRIAEPMSVTMPWGRGAAESIFSKGSTNPAIQNQQLKARARSVEVLIDSPALCGRVMVAAPRAVWLGALFVRTLSVVTGKNFLERCQKPMDGAIVKRFGIAMIVFLGSDVAQTVMEHGGNFQEQELGAYGTIESVIAFRSRELCFLAACGYAYLVLGFKDFEVVGLHQLMESGKANFMDKALAVYGLLELYDRCRHGDLALVDCVLNFYEAGGLVEVSTDLHKTAKTSKQKFQLLPTLTPAPRATGRVGAYGAVKASAALGLSLSGEIGGPIVRPTLYPGGGSCNRVMMSFDGANGPRVSLHSLEVTTFLGEKCGVAIPDKVIMGRHASATTETHAIRSRVFSASSVMKLQGVILSVGRLEWRRVWGHSERGHIVGQSAIYKTSKRSISRIQWG